MKKELLVLMGLLMGFVSFGQQSASEAETPFKESKRITAKPGHDQAKAIPFWTEDFANGFPASWSIQDSSGICPWTYSMDGSWGYWNGDNGATAGDAINSTTANNGFLICDPDSANHVNYGQPSGSTYQYLASYFTTSAINCSGRSSVILSFEQFFRYNNGVAMNVQVSNDGTNWTTYDVSGGQANNQASPNSQLVTLNITNEAANQATVYIRIGWSARVYFWQIDDISLREADPYDAMLGNNWWGTGIYQYEYHKIPLSQNSPVTFYSEVSNNTGAQLDDVYSSVSVANGGGTDFTGTSGLSNLAAVEMDTFVVTTNWTPTTADFHTIDFSCDVTGQTDGDLSNNDNNDSLQITNTLYGLDNLTDPSQSTASISNFSSNVGSPFSIGNIYEIMVDDGIQCVEIGIADDADNELKTIYAEVYLWDTTSASFVQIGYSDLYDIAAGDLGQIVSLPLFNETPVYAGQEILVVAGHYGGAVDGTDDVHFMYGQPVADQMVFGTNSSGDFLWLSNPRAIVCRIQFDCGLSVDELDNALQMEVYPNPANEEITVEFTPIGGNVSIELVDMNGKKVITEERKVSSGALNSMSISTSVLEEGVYTLMIQSDNTQVTERVVVIH